MTKLLLIIIMCTWFNSSSGVRLLIHQDKVECYVGEDVMLPVTYESDISARITWSRSPVCDLGDGFVWCNSCKLKDSPNTSTYTGKQIYERVNGFEKNASILIKNVQFDDGGVFCVEVANPEDNEKDVRNAAYAIITLIVNNAVLPRSVRCPVALPAPPSGIIATVIPGILLNNVDFMHIPIVLNFYHVSIADILHCENINMSFYKSALKDLISSYQERTQDSPTNQTILLESSNLGSAPSQDLDGIAKSLASLFADGMSIWNRNDLETIKQHLSYFQQQTTIKPSLHGIEGLANEAHYTVYNIEDLVKFIGKTQEKQSKLSPQQGPVEQDIICNVYGSFILTTVTSLLKDIESRKMPDIITDEEIARFYCPQCISKAPDSKYFWECVTSCKALQLNTIRTLASVTPHPNKGACYATASCSEQDAMSISFTLSLPVFGLTNSVFDQLANIQSFGLVEDNIFKERINLPKMVIYHPKLQTWLSPQTDCCSVKGYKYICRCDAFDVVIPVCGSDIQVQENKTDALTVSCPVKLTKWNVPIVKVTRNLDGVFCVATNHKTYTYGDLKCDIPNQNFCFTPHERTVIGHTIIKPFNFQNGSSVVNSSKSTNLFVPQFNVQINPLTMKLKSLMDHKSTHIIFITNNVQKDVQAVNEQIDINDSNLIDNSLDWVEVTVKVIIVLHVILILIVMFMLYVFCFILKQHGFKLDAFINPYLRMS